MYWNIKIVGNLLSLMQHPVVNYSHPISIKYKYEVTIQETISFNN